MHTERLHTAAAPMELKDPRLARLLAYWSAKAGERAMPSRADIDPVDLGFLLGHLMLIDVMTDPPRFKVRLHGSELARRAGYDLTGKMVDDLPINEFRNLARRSFATTVETRRPFHSRRDRLLDGKRHNYETIMLPLSADGVTVNMLLVGLVYEDAALRG